jgi:hypothetical protein
MSLAKFANFVYFFCIACGNCYHIWAEILNLFFLFHKGKDTFPK